MAFLAVLVAILSPFWLFLFTFLAWPVVVPVALVALGGMLFALIRSRTRFQRIALAVALAGLTLFAGLFGAVYWVSMFQHDRLMSELRDSACAVKPPGSEIVSCRSAGVENPFNGNQCGYSVEILLRTSSSPLEVERFYASGFHDALLRNDLFLAEPTVLSVASDPVQLERARLLFVGDEGADVRCM